MLAADDRMERPEGVNPRVVKEDHPIIQGLDEPWPYLLGFNEVKAKESGEVLALVGEHPLLVTGSFGKGRSVACDPFVALWNWLGVADLVVAMATGFFSASSRFQIFSLHAPDFLIGSFPLVMIPIYAVPLSIVLHLASLTKLRQGNAHLREKFSRPE